jgi:DNA-directed RNA polymerase I subunit RPA2
MGKQTMGTPCHSIAYRADNKLYRINFPQSPFVKTKLYDHMHIDDYPMGTNAIVAVVSYSVSHWWTIFDSESELGF